MGRMLAKFDCTTNKKTCERFSIEGFPTLYWFVKGKLALQYDDEHIARDIVEWVMDEHKEGDATGTAAKDKTPASRGTKTATNTPINKDDPNTGFDLVIEKAIIKGDEKIINKQHNLIMSMEFIVGCLAIMFFVI